MNTGVQEFCVVLYSKLTRDNSFYIESGTILDAATLFTNLPASFMKFGRSYISDAPSDISGDNNEFACIVYGNSERRVVFLTVYINTISNTYTRTIIKKEWYGEYWIKMESTALT